MSVAECNIYILWTIGYDEIKNNVFSLNTLTEKTSSKVQLITQLITLASITDIDFLHITIYLNFRLTAANKIST